MYRILGFAACALAAIACAPLQAALLPITQTGQSAAWIGLDDDNLFSIDEDDPVTTLTTIPMLGQVNASPNSFSVAENNFGGPPPIAGQSFLATKDGRVSNVQMLVSGAAATYDVHLYDLGASPPAPGGATTYSNALPDLLPANTWFQFFGTSNTSVVVLDLLGAGVNQVFLEKGNTYVWEIVGVARDSTGAVIGNTPNNTMTWNRNAPSAGLGGSYLPYGQAFRSRSALNGNQDRSFAFAAHLVPEPASLLIAALGGLALMAGVRRRS
jgi:hypothetical protein